MVSPRSPEKAIVLFIVLATIFIVILLANILLGIMASQSRLTHHKVSRIQAYYAAMAGVNYALEMLRVGPAGGGWLAGEDCLPASPCVHAFPADEFKPPLSNAGNSASIVIREPQSTDASAPCFNPPGDSACVYASVNYTYVP